MRFQVIMKTLFKCWQSFGFVHHVEGDRGGTVVEVLCYKSEGHWFDSRWCHWKFSLTYSFRSHYGPGVDSASNRNEYQENFIFERCIDMTSLNNNQLMHSQFNIY